MLFLWINQKLYKCNFYEIEYIFLHKSCIFFLTTLWLFLGFFYDLLETLKDLNEKMNFGLRISESGGIIFSFSKIFQEWREFLKVKNLGVIFTEKVFIIIEI